MENVKLKKAAKNWDVVAKVCKGIFGAVGIVCFIFAILVLIFGEKVFQLDSASLDLDFVKVYLSSKYHAVTKPLQIFAITALIAIGMLCQVVVFGIKQIREILEPMQEGRPFEKSVPDNLRKIAWTILTGGVIVQIVGITERILLIKAYPMEQLFSSMIDHIEYTFTFDFGFVLVACIVLLLSYVFAYGQKLQQESDETL